MLEVGGMLLVLVLLLLLVVLRLGLQGLFDPWVVGVGLVVTELIVCMKPRVGLLERHARRRRLPGQNLLSHAVVQVSLLRVAHVCLIVLSWQLAGVIRGRHWFPRLVVKGRPALILHAHPMYPRKRVLLVRVRVACCVD